jgi:hypothetical protein
MSNQLQNKLLQYEVQPPAELWRKIAESLDEHDASSLSGKLYQYETEPSPGVWNKIEVQLDQPGSLKKSSPFYIRYRRPLKYSGAVAAMVVIAVLVSLLFSKKSESNLATDNITTKVIKKDPAKSNLENPVEEIRNSVTRSLQRDQIIPSFSKTKTLRTKKVNYQSSFLLSEHFLPETVEKGPAITSSSIPGDKYMIYSDGNGNAVRLPKKIYNAVACPTDNFECQRRLRELKDKFVSAAVTSDFNGILEILKSLQENQ